MTDSRRALIVVAAFVLMAIGLPWGGNVPEAFAQISVIAADPPTGEQGTLNLSVIIKGKGFKNGAKAKFYKTGTTDPAGVNVKSTQFVSSTQLIALIDIADAATLTLFDIEVRNADGRTGKGTELFSVLEKTISPCSLPDPEPTLSTNVAYGPGFPGYLDGTFDNGGKVIGPRHIRKGGPRGRPIAIDSAGRVVFVGNRYDHCATNAPVELAIVRYLPDGSPDTGFGLNGVVRIAFGGGRGSASSVAVQADDKIVVAGGAQPSKASSSQAMVIRLNANGSLDPAFGSGGIAWVSPFGTKVVGSFDSVTLQSDGKILAAGALYSGYVKLISRLNTNGTLDLTFNGSGYYRWNAEGAFSSVTTQLVGPDERIVVAGHIPDGLGHSNGAIWRFTGAGALDTSFGGTGVVQTAFQGEDGQNVGDGFKDVVIDRMNRIVATGNVAITVPPDVVPHFQTVLARYDENGSLDTSFDVDGRVWAPAVQESSVGQAIAVDVDGRILVAGYSDNNAVGTHVAVVWRLNDNGTPDTTTFGTGGWVSDPIASGTNTVYWQGIALQADGRIICGGTVTMAGDPSIWYPVLARLWQ